MSYVAPNIDPYRKGQSFASWFKRLGQAEYCNFKDDKNSRILDRVLIGLSDDTLRQKLLTEDGENCNLAQVEKTITTWEMAASNAKALTKDDVSAQIASIGSLTGGRGAVLQRIADLAQGRSRAPVKSRLGYRPQYYASGRNQDQHLFEIIIFSGPERCS